MNFDREFLLETFIPNLQIKVIYNAKSLYEDMLIGGILARARERMLGEYKEAMKNKFSYCRHPNVYGGVYKDFPNIIILDKDEYKLKILRFIKRPEVRELIQCMYRETQLKFGEFIRNSLNGI